VPDDAPFLPSEIIRVLREHDVDYVLVGGLAAYVRGSALFTNDADIAPRMELGNLARLSAALYELDARIRTDAVESGLKFHHNAESLIGTRVWNLVTKYGDLDLTIEPAGTRGYEDVRRDATGIEFEGIGVTVVVASLADIIRSKEAANRDKDHRMLPALRELLAEQRAAEREAGEDR
jgi:hypothetical protein